MQLNYCYPKFIHNKLYFITKKLYLVFETVKQLFWGVVTSLYASMCKDETFARRKVNLTGRRQNTLFQSICRTIHTNSYQLPVASTGDFFFSP